MKSVLIYITLITSFLLTACLKPAKPLENRVNETMSEITPHQNENVNGIEDSIDFKIDWGILYDIDNSKWIADQLNNKVLVVDLVPLFSQNLLPRLYKYNKYKLVWISEKNIKDAYRALELSWLDGLSPQDYHLDKLEALQKKILSANSKEEKDVFVGIHDIILTDAVIMYGFHLLIGKVDPVLIDNNWNYKNKTISKKTVLYFLDVLKNQQILEGLDQIRPKNVAYRAMMNALLFYHNQPDEKWVAINGFEKLELGDTNHYVPQIRKRLSLCCQGNVAALDSLVFDSTLYKDILHFQLQHGVEEDGVIGKGTVELLNLTPKQRTEKLKVNLERLRWLGDEQIENVIEVNIAAFKLYVKQNDSLIYECNVVTGLPYHKTPIFTAKLKYIDFNPTWTVPYSIATKEILPKLKRQGASYLKKNDMELLNSSGKLINPFNVNFSALSISNFPYIIRQKPGLKNALGQVKFVFPNSYSVYMHDTPSKSLFSKVSRAFSHGCIRVEHPLKLAEVLLDDKKQWDRDKIDQVIAEKKTKTVTIKREIDVKILYYTSGLFPDGTLYYLADIYDRDREILKELEKPFDYTNNTTRRIYPEKDSIWADSLLDLEIHF